MYKEDLILNHQQWLTCHKTKQNLREYLNFSRVVVIVVAVGFV